MILEFPGRRRRTDAWGVKREAVDDARPRSIKRCALKFDDRLKDLENCETLMAGRRLMSALPSSQRCLTETSKGFFDGEEFHSIEFYLIRLALDSRLKLTEQAMLKKQSLRDLLCPIMTKF